MQESCVDWFIPLSFLSKNHLNEKKSKIAILVLNLNNSPNTFTSSYRKYFCEIWNRAEYRACADGGANFIHNLIENQNSLGDTSVELPHLISGDFDSITQDVKKYFETLPEIEVVETPDQDNTDFTKSVKLIGQKLQRRSLNIKYLVVIAAQYGRFDQTMANINTLYRTKDYLPSTTKTCLLCHESYISLLNEGKSILKVNTGFEGSWCGLLPIGNDVKVTTKGLKWNLSNTVLKFGELVSTSNELDGSGEVIIDSDKPVIWTMAQTKLL